MDGWRRLAWLTLLAAPAIVAGTVYALTGRGVPCPVLLATGWQCPLCGASRMGVALLEGDLSSAWHWNPFALVLGVVFGAVWIWTGVRALTGRSAGLPGPLSQLDRIRSETILVVILGLAVLFGLARNLA